MARDEGVPLAFLLGRQPMDRRPRPVEHHASEPGIALESVGSPARIHPGSLSREEPESHLEKRRHVVDAVCRMESIKGSVRRTDQNRSPRVSKFAENIQEIEMENARRPAPDILK